MSTIVRLNAITMVKTIVTDKYSRTSWADLPEEVNIGMLDNSQRLYVKYQSLDNQYKNKIVESLKIYFKAKDGTYVYSEGDIRKLYEVIRLYSTTESWDENTISYDNAPDKGIFSSVLLTADRSLGFVYQYGEYQNFDYFKEKYILQLLQYGGLIQGDYYISQGYIRDYPLLKHRDFLDLPYIELTFSDNTTSLSIDSCSPSSGFQPKYSANTYNWSVSPTSFSIENPTVAHAYYRYRVDASSQYTEVDCGSALFYTMPANTITTDSFQWQVSILDSNGHTTTTDWYTISTEEELSTATIVSPKNTTIDGSDINRFEWLHTISTGTAQKSADLQKSTDNGTTWTTLATVSGASTYVNIPANTFNAGSYIWRVRTYNTDNVAGSWSESKPFTVIAKPIVSAVSSEQNPKPKISWQADTQQAYRVYIDNVFDSGVIFGTATNYTLPIYLDDGSYTVNVIVQNNYGLWSNPANAPINVTNTYGTEMTLISINETGGLHLSWTPVLSYAYYVVYRDGIAIAKTRDNEYTDSVSLGTHEYFIRGIYASTKFYGLSNTITVNIVISKLMITDLNTETSMSIEQNDSSYAELSITDSINNTSLYISANDYPINEISHFKKKYISFACAFKKNSDDAILFRSMLGDLVCIKTPSGTSIIGNLLEQRRNENYFYEKYSCTLEQTNYEEEIQL